MPSLQQQIWVKQLLKNFYAATDFLAYFKNYSEFVNYNVINIITAGIDPEVLINNTTYPIAIVSNLDIPNEIPLSLFQTKNTFFQYNQSLEYSYDKMEAVIYAHRNSLQQSTGAKAAHAVSPQTSTAKTPLLVTTGDNDGTGRKRLISADLLKLKTVYDTLKYPLDKRYLVLDPLHVADLITEDLKAFKNIVDLKEGLPQRFLGFNVLQFVNNPSYNINTMQKNPYNAVMGANDVISSFAFYTDEVCKADGDAKMFSRIDDPEMRGNVIGFEKRFIAMPIRNQGVAAILSGKV